MAKNIDEWKEYTEYLRLCKLKLGMTNQELADYLGEPEPKTRTRIYRLKQKFGDYNEETDDLADLSKVPTFEGEEPVVVENSPNEIQVIFKGGKRIKTENDLRKYHNIHLEDWEVTKQKAGYYEQAQKLKVTKEDESYEQPIVIGLHVVRAEYVRRNPIQLMPTLKSVEFAFKSAKVEEPKLVDGAYRVLVWNDPHFGFWKDLRTNKLTSMHDRLVLDIILQVLRDYEFSHVINLGDIFDFAEWSDKFLKEPEFYFTTQPAIVEAGWWLAQYKDAQQDALHVILQGNHDKRPTIQLKKHFLHGYGLTPHDEMDLPDPYSVARLLSLHRMGIEYVDEYPDASFWIGDEEFTHGDKVRQGSGASATVMTNGRTHSVNFGHVHRMEQAYRTVHVPNGRGKTEETIISATSFGATCKTTGEVPGRSKKQNWQQGFGIKTIYPGGKIPSSTEFIPIKNGKAFYRGKLYTGQDRKSQIAQETGWQF